MGVRIGIDLGTTYSAVARIDPATHRAVVVPNSFGEHLTASALAFEPAGSVLFGEEAKDEVAAGNPNAVAFYKREMGDASFRFPVGGKDLTATDLSATFLRLLVADAEKVMGEKVDGAVITVPAYFAHLQVKATIDAAALAGIRVISTIHEPTAAAIAYGLDKADTERTVLFYDLGGGTFDVTIAKVSRDGVTVLGSDGDHRLGGKNWDDAIARHIASVLAEEHGIDVSEDDAARTAILAKAEPLKRQLTSRASASMALFVVGKHVSVAMTQDEFAQITEALCAMTLDIIEVLFGGLSLGWADIDSVILVGGSTRMPMIRAFLSGHSSTTIEAGVHVDEAVALGAAIKANAVNELGAIGAGRDAAPAGSAQLAIGFRVTEVVAHALGMIAVNRAGDAYVNSEIIRKNSPIPVSATRTHAFKASARNQEMEIYVLQGGLPRPLDNTVVNKYVAAGIQTCEGDGEHIDVTYSYDPDGLVVVSAQQDGRELSVRIDKVPEDMSWADRPPRAPMSASIVLALDLSGSMSGAPLDQAKTAMQDDFIGKLDGSEALIGVLLFADQARWLSRPTPAHAELRKQIKTITIGQDGVGYGNATHPFELGDAVGDGDYLIVLTDGVWSEQETAIARAQALHKKGITVIALGFGSADLAFLKRIASTEEMAGLTDLSKLGDSFGRIAQVVKSGSGSIALR